MEEVIADCRNRIDELKSSLKRVPNDQVGVDNTLGHFDNGFTVKTLIVLAEPYSESKFEEVSFLPFLKEGETAFGKSGHYVYVYDKSHRVNKFKLVWTSWNGKFIREDLRRESSDYVTSFRNTDEGRKEYKKVKTSLKVIHPNGRLNILYRCPQKATKDRGSVPKSVASHFDVYFRQPSLWSAYQR